MVSGMDRFEDSLLATGFPYDRRTSSENNFDAFVAIKQRCQAVRRCGSAALDLCMVAAGRLDAYYEDGVHVSGQGTRLHAVANPAVCSQRMEYGAVLVRAPADPTAPRVRARR